MRFSLVVCTLGRSQELADLFNSLLRQERDDFEVILVDQNPDDRLVEIVSQFVDAMPIRHVRQTVKGASSGRNAGLDLITGDLVGFPDDDCQYFAGYLDAIDKVFSQDMSIGCLTGFPTDDIEKKIGQNWDAKKEDLDAFRVLDRCQEFTVFVRRDSLGELRYNRYLGVGSQTLWGADEAPDLLIRLIKAGVRTVYFPLLLVYHPNKIRGMNRAVLERAASYSRGRGCLFRLHQFPVAIIARSLFRPAVGSVVYLLRFWPKKSWYYLTICKGILRGLTMSKTELEDVRKGWQTEPSQIASFAPLALTSLSSKPLVSILIANYNYARFLPSALDSLLAQTYTHWQAVICDDGSTDNSVEVIKRYCQADHRFKLVCKSNGGQNSTYNFCYEETEGEIVCFLDADDFFDKHKVERIVEAMQRNPTAGMCNHFSQVIDEVGVPEKVIMQNFLDSGWLADKALKRGACIYVPTTSCMSIRREIGDLVFPVTPRQERDLDGYLAMLAQFFAPICVIEEKLTSYRLHGSNMGGTTQPTPLRLNYELKLIEQRTANVKEFIKQKFGEPTAKLIVLEDNPQYIQAALKLLAVESQNEKFLDARDLIRRHPNVKWRAIWTLIFAVPKFVGRGVVTWLHESHRFKSFMHRFLAREKVAVT